MFLNVFKKSKKKFKKIQLKNITLQNQKETSQGLKTFNTENVFLSAQNGPEQKDDLGPNKKNIFRKIVKKRLDKVKNIYENSNYKNFSKPLTISRKLSKKMSILSASSGKNLFSSKGRFLNNKDTLESKINSKKKLKDKLSRLKEKKDGSMMIVNVKSNPKFVQKSLNKANTVKIVGNYSKS